MAFVGSATPSHGAGTAQFGESVPCREAGRSDSDGRVHNSGGYVHQTREVVNPTAKPAPDCEDFGDSVFGDVDGYALGEEGSVEDAGVDDEHDAALPLFAVGVAVTA